MTMLKDARARIIRRESWGNYHLLGIRTPEVAQEAQPGQFVMVKVSDRSYPLLRRPFSIHAREGEAIEIFFARIGVGTAILAEKQEGERLDILGPLGKGFAIENKLKEKTVFLAGGGRGIAPLYFLAQEMRGKKVNTKVFYGGRTAADLPILEKFHSEAFDVFVSTDDGSLGFKGLASELLKKEIERSRPAHICACGPEPMMKTIAALANARHIPAQFSLESIMGCGIGACWGCVTRIKRGAKAEWVKICEEGPVFSGSEIVWEGKE